MCGRRFGRWLARAQLAFEIIAKQLDELVGGVGVFFQPLGGGDERIFGLPQASEQGFQLVQGDAHALELGLLLGREVFPVLARRQVAAEAFFNSINSTRMAFISPLALLAS